MVCLPNTDIQQSGYLPATKEQIWDTMKKIDGCKKNVTFKLRHVQQLAQETFAVVRNEE
jgi:hypothetical protein